MRGAAQSGPSVRGVAVTSPLAPLPRSGFGGMLLIDEADSVLYKREAGQARQAMQRDGDTKGAQRLTNRMTDMAKGLKRDAQVESLLRSRTRELGIKTELGRDLARDLATSISMERSRSIGMGL